MPIKQEQLSKKKKKSLQEDINSVSHYYITVKVTEHNQEKRKETNHLDVTKPRPFCYIIIF